MRPSSIGFFQKIFELKSSVRTLISRKGRSWLAKEGPLFEWLDFADAETGTSAGLTSDGAATGASAGLASDGAVTCASGPRE